VSSIDSFRRPFRQNATRRVDHEHCDEGQCGKEDDEGRGMGTCSPDGACTAPCYCALSTVTLVDCGAATLCRPCCQVVVGRATRNRIVARASRREWRGRPRVERRSDIRGRVYFATLDPGYQCVSLRGLLLVRAETPRLPAGWASGSPGREL